MENRVEYPQDLDLELYVAVVGSQSATVNVRAPLVSFPTYNAMTEVKPGQVQAYGFAYSLRNVGQGITGNSIYVRYTFTTLNQVLFLFGTSTRNIFISGTSTH